MSLHRFELSPEIAEVERLAQEIQAFGERHGLAADVVAKLNLVLEELVTNSILHGFDDRPDGHSVVVALAWDGRSVEARVEDDGKPFDPLSLPAPDTKAPLEERDAGGLGVLLVRKLMDEVRYRRVHGRNVITLKLRP